MARGRQPERLREIPDGPGHGAGQGGGAGGIAAEMAVGMAMAQQMMNQSGGLMGQATPGIQAPAAPAARLRAARHFPIS